MPQLEIWVFPDQPLKQSEWLKQGYISLEDYVQKQIEGHSGHQKKVCKICQDLSILPLVSFGKLGESKEIVLTCETEKELPIKDLDGVLIFD